MELLAQGAIAQEAGHLWQDVVRAHVDSSGRTPLHKRRAELHLVSRVLKDQKKFHSKTAHQ
jgi:Ser-tRNA(Ala) deacylase AlaX